MLGFLDISDSENVSETGVVEGWLEVRANKQPECVFVNFFKYMFFMQVRV